MKKIHAQAQKALELMLEAQLPPTPSNYEFWFHYVTKSDPYLVAAIDELRLKNQPIHAQTISKLRLKFFGVSDIDKIDNIVDKTSLEIEKLSGIVENAGGDARSFQSALQDGQNILSRSSGHDEHTSLLDQIASATAVMSERTRKLEAQLAISSQEVAALRHDLDKARTESRTDPLTGLPNRKAFLAYFESQAARSVADKYPISVLFCDIDHFKTFNDTWGHRMGDEVLRLVGQSLEQLVSGLGYPSRFGGEEFVIGLPHKDITAAFDIAEQIRDYIATKSLKSKQSNKSIGRITLSVGVAQMRWSDSVETLIERADKALYMAKEGGRNMVCYEAPIKTISQNSEAA